jgi:hypothetical protein
VFVEVHVADPVQLVLDHLVAADDGRELGGAGPDSGQRGDRADDPAGPFLLPGQLVAAHDQVSDFVDYLKAGAAEGSEVLYPGEYEQRTAKERSRDGILVEDKTCAALQALDQA